jgi:outer membrane protein
MKNALSILSLFIAIILSNAVISQADDDLQHYVVRVRASYVMPTEYFDSRLEGPGKPNPTVSNNIIPELDLEYYFTKYISTEVIAGVSRHTINLSNGVQGSTYLLPPSITFKYHPIPSAKISPYVGAGVELTFPFNYHLNGVPDFKIDQSFGWAAQAGADIKLKDNIYLNVDYKFLDVDTEVKIAGVKYKADLNPHLFSVGVGYRF